MKWYEHLWKVVDPANVCVVSSTVWSSVCDVFIVQTESELYVCEAQVFIIL